MCCENYRSIELDYRTIALDCENYRSILTSEYDICGFVKFYQVVSTIPIDPLNNQYCQILFLIILILTFNKFISKSGTVFVKRYINI